MCARSDAACAASVCGTLKLFLEKNGFIVKNEEVLHI